jgi:hypothetical protein
MALQRLLSKHQTELATFDAAADHRRVLLEGRRDRFETSAKSRSRIVTMQCSRMEKPRLREPIKTPPARVPKAPDVGRTLLPQLIPPNDPARYQKYVEENNRRVRMQREACARVVQRGEPRYARVTPPRPSRYSSDEEWTEEGDESQSATESLAGARAERPWETDGEAETRSPEGDGVFRTEVEKEQLAAEETVVEEEKRSEGGQLSPLGRGDEVELADVALQTEIVPDAPADGIESHADVVPEADASAEVIESKADAPAEII